MNALAILKAVYESEVSVSLSWFWDGGYDIKAYPFGPHSGSGEYQHESNFDTIEECMAWLAGTVVRKDPESEFAKRFNSGEFGDIASWSSTTEIQCETEQ